jgi:ABC-2 type transport system permease protein
VNWAQLRGMIWLRWRLTRNQWRRRGQIETVLTLVLIALALGTGLLGGLAGIAGGWFGLSKASPLAHLLVWDILTGMFLMFWSMGVVADLQRSEMLDLSRLLILPVSLREVFLLNYLSSHFSLSLAVVLPAMLGLSLGLVLGSGLAMVLLLPLVFAFFFMITAWTYCLRGWLASLMMNKRRRRAVLIAIPFAIALLGQVPNVMVNAWSQSRQMDAPQPTDGLEARVQRVTERNARDVAVVKQVHQYVPFLWLAFGERRLAQGNPWPAIWGALGMFGIGAVGLAYAYRSTMRFYRGGKTKKKAPAPSAAPAVRGGRRILVERKVPAAPEEAGAMAMASLRSMLRAPEVKMALATNVFIIMFLGMTMALGRSIKMADEIKPLVACGAAVLAVMGLAQLMFNHFGFDRTGFRAIVLLPTPRRYILLGKNLAVLPLALAGFAIYLGLAAFLMRLRVWDIAAGIVEFAAALLLMSVFGNLVSIMVPYRIAAGSLRPTKTNFTTNLLVFVTHLCFPTVLLPIFVPAGLGLLAGSLSLLPAAAVTLVGAVVVAGLAGGLYWWTLEPLGNLLQRREQRILEVVTREVE